MAYNKNTVMHTQQTMQPYVLVPQSNVEELPNKAAKMETKEINWGKKTAHGISKNATMDLPAEFASLLREIREDLSNLRRLHYAIMSAQYFEIPYKKENKDKAEEYKKDLQKINDLSRGEKNAANLNELRIILDRLDLDIENFDAIFPQLVYSSVHLKDYLAITVDQIGYKEYKVEAETALKLLKVTEKKLNLNALMLSDEGSETASVSAVIHSLNVLNEMQEYKTKILALKEKDYKQGYDTRRMVLTGMSITLLILFVGIFSLYWMEVSWNDIRKFPILGIPFGICIWAFIGSFAAMLQQFYQKPIYEFGDTLKWVIIRPVLGVVMGSAIYLAFSNGFGVDVSTGNGGLSYLIAFFVGLSDSFTFGIIDRLQGALISSVKDKPTPPQPVIMMPANTVTIANENDPILDNHLSVVEKPVETKKKPLETIIDSKLSNTVDIHNDVDATLGDKGLNGGEDE